MNAMKVIAGVVSMLVPATCAVATPGHVRNLVRRMQSEGIGVLFAANYFDRSKVERVADRSGARTVIVRMEPGGAPGVDSYFDLVDTWVDALARAFGNDL